MAKRYNYTIVFQDDHLILVDKAPGISVVRERDPQIKECLFDEVKEKLKSELFLVHRIDKDTSGLLLFAKTEEAQQILSQQFSDGSVQKKYLAIVTGSIESEEWQTIDLPIFKKRNDIKVSIQKKGKPSLTKYRMLENYNQSTLLDVEILTGRTHQIRVHMAHIGHPLLIDPVYGNKSELFLSEILKRNFRSHKYEQERPLMARQTLHSASISFQHPSTGKILSFSCDAPKDFRALVNQLRKMKNKM